MSNLSMTLRIDEWTGERCKNNEIADITTAEFDAWLDQMDAAKHTLLMLAPSCSDEPVAHLAIGGGAGRYVVYMTDDNETFWSLLSDSASSDEVILIVAGGQKGDYPARRVVGIEQARSAGHS